MTDLTHLIERVKSGSGADRALDRDIAVALRRYPEGDVYPAEWLDAEGLAYLTSSLDAVRDLIGEKLPGLTWALGQNVHYRYWLGTVNDVSKDDGCPYTVGRGEHNTSDCRALLCAALTALLALQSLAKDAQDADR